MLFEEMNPADARMWFSGTFVRARWEDMRHPFPVVTTVSFESDDPDETGELVLCSKRGPVYNGTGEGVELIPILFEPKNINTSTPVGSYWVSRGSYNRHYKKSISPECVGVADGNAPAIIKTIRPHTRDLLWIMLTGEQEYPTPWAARKRLMENEVWSVAFSEHFAITRSLNRRELLLAYKGIVVGMFPYSRQLKMSVINRCKLLPDFSHLAEELAPYTAVEILDAA